ncbi:hypothetical protein BDR22DRAFT_932188 [Usnea florida]
MAMDAKESDREATVANAQTRVGKPFKELKRIGVDIIHEPSEPTVAVVDIVFVHGLTGTPASTWLHKSGMYWPAKLLSCDIPNSRILSFGYDADVVNFWNPVSQNRIGHHASNMLGDLTRRREKSGTCLNLSKSNAEKHLQQVSSCTIGIVFLGTPHHGADAAAWAKFGATVAKTIKHVNTDIISVLESGSEMLARVQDGFHSLLRLRRREQSEIDVTCFFEELPLPIGMVVDSQSAILPSYPSYGIHANHMDMTKFDDKDSAGYESVLGELRRWVKKLQLALDPKFIDRAKIFNLIEERTETESRIVLSGIGGVGKSQIAIEYCYRFREAHPDAHVFWVHSSTSQRLNQAYRDIARKLALPGWNDLKSDILRSVFEWFNEADNGQWLIVLDNADDRDIFFTKTTSIGADSQPTRPFIDYLPRSSQGLMLITTRDARMSRQLAGTDKPIVVEAMLPSEAQDLLRSRSERPGSDNDDNSRVLVDELAYIPLAITQAAAFISENDISLANYLEILRTGDSDLQDLLDQDLGDLRRDSESRNSVIRTWKVSFDLISKQNPRAAEMLSLMAVLDRQGIPESLLRNYTDRETDFVTARGILKKFSMISTEDGGSKYELHRLVQLATRKWLEIQGVKKMWQEKALLMLENMYPSLEDWTTCESLLPHAQTVTQYENLAEARPIQFADLLDKMAYFDMVQGRYEIAHTRALAAFEVHKKFSDLEHPSTFRSMSTLAGVYIVQGRWDEAKQLRVRVVDTSLKVLKEEHPETLENMADLALWYYGQERWDEAETLQLRVMKTSLRVLKDEHPISLQIMSNLAATYREQERWDEAEELQVRVIEIQKRARKEEHPHTLETMADLAKTYAEQRRLDEAEELLVQVIEIRKRVLTENHPDTLDSIINLGSFMFFLATAYLGQSRLEEAIRLFQVVIELRTKTLGANHPDTLEAIEALDKITRVSESQQMVD